MSDSEEEEHVTSSSEEPEEEEVEEEAEEEAAASEAEEEEAAASEAEEEEAAASEPEDEAAEEAEKDSSSHHSSSHHSSSHHSSSHHSSDHESAHGSEGPDVVEVVEEEDAKSENSSSSSSKSESFGQTVCCSVIGGILILIATYLHYKNEQSAIRRTELYNHAAAVIVEFDGSDQQGKLIHSTTEMELPDGRLRDSRFYSYAPYETCAKLVREVKMYQWVESSSTKTSKGKKKTTYKYEKKWSSIHYNSDAYNDKSRKNPSFDEKRHVETGRVLIKSKQASLTLTAAFTDQITWANAKVNSKSYYCQHKRATSCSTRASKKIGDYKLTWTCYGAHKDKISVVGKVDSTQLVPYNTTLRMLWSKFETGNLDMLQAGAADAKTMIDKKRTVGKFMVWLFRILLIIACIVGSILFWGPLSYCLDKIPCCGDCLAGAVNCIAGTLGFLWALIVMIVCWIIVRPWLILILALCILAIVAIFLGKKFTKGKDEEKADPEAAKGGDEKAEPEE